MTTPRVGIAPRSHARPTASTSGESVTLDDTSDSCTACPGDVAAVRNDRPQRRCHPAWLRQRGDLTSTTTPDGNGGSEVAEDHYGYDGDGEQTTLTAPDGNLPGMAASMPVVQSTASYSGTSSASSATWSHTIGAGSDRYLYVAVTTNATASGSVTGVTYGGTAMTELSDEVDATTSNGHRDMSVWGLVAPAVGTANVVATLSTSYSAVSGVSVGLVNVNQSTPTGTIQTDTGGSVGAQSLSTTTAGSSSDLNLSALGWRDDEGLATAGSGQTLLGTGEGGSGSGFAVTQVSEQEGGSVTDGWSWDDGVTASDEITVPIRSASGPDVPVVQATATYSGSGSASSAVWSQTVEAGMNRYLYVAVTTNGTATGSVTGVTYDSVSMTKLSDVIDSTSAGKNRDLSIWGLVSAGRYRER